MKTYKRLRTIQTSRGTKTYVDATSGTRTVTEWDSYAEAE